VRRTAFATAADPIFATVRSTTDVNSSTTATSGASASVRARVTRNCSPFDRVERPQPRRRRREADRREQLHDVLHLHRGGEPVEDRPSAVPLERRRVAEALAHDRRLA
jgi:hypothetical protein